MIGLDSLKLNPVQKAAFSLIQQDLRYIYTVIKYINPQESNYIPSMLPYLGVVIDGAEDWLKAIKNSSKCDFCIPLFNEEQTIFYEQIRNSIKMCQQDYNDIYALLGRSYRKSDDYFGSVCKPIAKVLNLYDIYGMDTINGVICGNTILCHYYSPFFSYNVNNGEFIKLMSEIGGRYINLFNAVTEFQVNNELQFGVQDYGGFIKSPVGNVYSDKKRLLDIREIVRGAIKTTDKDIAKTALLAKGFREAGQTAANAFRTFADKPEVNYSQKEQKHPITKAVLAPMKAVKKMFVSMELHLDASIDKLDNLAMNVQLDKEKHMENAKAQEQTESERAEAERVEAEVVYSPMVAEPQEYQYNADAFEARGVGEVKQEVSHKEVSKVREDKAR